MAKPKKSKRHEQQYIPGTAPVEVPEVRDALHAWLDAKDEQRRNSKAVKLAHDVLIGHMQEQKIERYPYTDSITGKKKHVFADRTAKAKVINAPRSAKNDNRDADYERPGIEAVIADPNADKVESRRVGREGVEAELAERDAKVKLADDAGPKLVRGDGDPSRAESKP
jgi:hypothetical protein